MNQVEYLSEIWNVWRTRAERLECLFTNHSFNYSQIISIVSNLSTLHKFQFNLIPHWSFGLFFPFNTKKLRELTSCWYALVDRKFLSLQFRFTCAASPWSFSVYLEWNVRLLLIFLSIFIFSPVLRMGNNSASHCIKYESQPMMAGKLRIKPRFHCSLETSSQESPSYKLYYTDWVIYFPKIKNSL